MKVLNKLTKYKNYLKVLAAYIEDKVEFYIYRWVKRKNFHHLKQFKDKYKGERCFLIGTGPSLTYEDIEKLKDEKTFAVNSFVKAINEISFIPTFYGFIDGECMQLYGNEIITSGIEHIFFTKRTGLKKGDYKKLIQAGACELPQMNTGDWIYYAPRVPKSFSEDISKEVYWGYTVTYTMLQVINYMGFSEVYLLGMDCAYKPGIENFKDCRSQEVIQSGQFLGKSGAVDKFIDAYQAAKEYADVHKIKIYNATRGGMLEVFSRVHLEDVLENRKERKSIG